MLKAGILGCWYSPVATTTLRAEFVIVLPVTTGIRVALDRIHLSRSGPEAGHAGRTAQRGDDLIPGHKAIRLSPAYSAPGRRKDQLGVSRVKGPSGRCARRWPAGRPAPGPGAPGPVLQVVTGRQACLPAADDDGFDCFVHFAPSLINGTRAARFRSKVTIY